MLSRQGYRWISGTRRRIICTVKGSRERSTLALRLDYIYAVFKYRIVITFSKEGINGEKLPRQGLKFRLLINGMYFASLSVRGDHPLT